MATTRWDQAAQQIERLGGTRQVFDAINAVDPQTLNGEDSNRKGPYAFVGRVGSTAPLAETSESFDGLPAGLTGVLMRARDGGYEPMLAAPPARRRPDAGQHRADPHRQPGAAALPGVQGHRWAADRRGERAGGTELPRRSRRDRPVLCGRPGMRHPQELLPELPRRLAVDPGRPDQRQGKCSEPHQGFTAAQCEGIRTELRDEVSKVAKVAHYSGRSASSSRSEQPACPRWPTSRRSHRRSRTR